MMGYAIKICPDKVDLLEVNEIDLKFLREQIGCMWIEEIPSPYGYVIVDEEYLLNHPPCVNTIASNITGEFVNGIAILLDATESDFVPYSKEEAEQIREKLLATNDSTTNK